MASFAEVAPTLASAGLLSQLSTLVCPNLVHDLVEQLTSSRRQEVNILVHSPWHTYVYTAARRTYVYARHRVIRSKWTTRDATTTENQSIHIAPNEEDISLFIEGHL